MSCLFLLILKKTRNASVKTDLRKKYSQFDFIILMASRFSREKNIGMAIGAMAETAKERPKTGLIIIGSGTENKNYKLQIKKHKLEKMLLLKTGLMICLHITKPPICFC